MVAYRRCNERNTFKIFGRVVSFICEFFPERTFGRRMFQNILVTFALSFRSTSITLSSHSDLLIEQNTF